MLSVVSRQNYCLWMIEVWRTNDSIHLRFSYEHISVGKSFVNNTQIYITPKLSISYNENNLSILDLIPKIIPQILSPNEMQGQLVTQKCNNNKSKFQSAVQSCRQVTRTNVNTQGSMTLPKEGSRNDSIQKRKSEAWIDNFLVELRRVGNWIKE